MSTGKTCRNRTGAGKSKNLSGFLRHFSGIFRRFPAFSGVFRNFPANYHALLLEQPGPNILAQAAVTGNDMDTTLEWAKRVIKLHLGCV